MNKHQKKLWRDALCVLVLSVRAGSKFEDFLFELYRGVDGFGRIA